MVLVLKPGATKQQMQSIDGSVPLQLPCLRHNYCPTLEAHHA